MLSTHMRHFESDKIGKILKSCLFEYDTHVWYLVEIIVRQAENLILSTTF